MDNIGIFVFRGDRCSSFWLVEARTSWPERLLFLRRPKTIIKSKSGLVVSQFYVFTSPNKPCIFFFLIVCFTSYFVFRIAVLPHSPGVVYYHILLRRETRIPGVAPFSFRIGIWDLFVHRGQKSYTPTAFGKLWTTPGVRCMKHPSSSSMMRPGPEWNREPLD